VILFLGHRRSTTGAAVMPAKSSQQNRKQTLSASSPANAPDVLVVDKQARKECGNVSRMTFHRWENDPELGLPPAIHINKRKYRWRSQLEKFKEKLKAKRRRP
jgi:hypothetical protein